MKGAIIYKGKYGATRQYATWLGEQLGLPVLELENAGATVIAELDYLILGASIYIGKTQHKDWLERNASLIKDKKLFYFIVCGTPLTEKQKLEQIIEKNIPPVLQQPSSVWFLLGRLIIKNLSWKDRMMLKMGAKLEKNPDVKKNMLSDFDEVKKENLTSLIKAVMVHTRQARNNPQKLPDVSMA
jgi:menaquinone-dependent protoporphyrinogen IX oxidase